MSSTDPIKDAIADAAVTPQSISIDGQTVTERSISEQIEADKYLRSRQAANDATGGLRFGRFIPPGPMGDRRR